MHVRFHLIDAKAQQEALGIMGVNLIYGAYYKHNKPRSLIKYLYDHIDPHAIEIDTINFSGPLFENVDNRLLSLDLVKNGMTQAVMFGPDGKNILPAAELYKKNILLCFHIFCENYVSNFLKIIGKTMCPYVLRFGA